MFIVIEAAFKKSSYEPIERPALTHGVDTMTVRWIDSGLKIGKISIEISGCQKVKDKFREIISQLMQ